MRQQFLEPGRDCCEVRGARCEAKNFSVVFLSRFVKVIPRIHAAHNPQQTLVLLTWDFETPGTPIDKTKMNNVKIVSFRQACVTPFF